MMSLPAMSLGLRFCVSRKGRTGGGGWVHPKVANCMATSGLIFRSDLVGTGRTISVLCAINGVRNKRSHLVGPPFPEFKAHFSATAGWHFSRDLKLVGVVRARIWLSMKLPEIPLGAVLSLTTGQNRKWDTFKSCRV